jgi:hypothetical protein
VQGKRREQLEFSYMMIGFSIISILVTFVGFLLYHIISSLLHYIMG